MTGEISVDLAVTDQELHEARLFQAARYLDVGFVESVSDTGVIDDEWVAVSEYHVARDDEGEIAGVCRFVHPSDRGLPMRRIFDIEPEWSSALDEHADVVFEMGALAVDPAKSNLAVAAMLYRQTVRQYRVHPGHVHLVAALDSRVLRAMRATMHFPFQTIGESKMLMGGKSVPVYLYLPGALAKQVVNAPEAGLFFTGFDTIDLVEREALDLRSKYPEITPVESIIDLVDDAGKTEERSTAPA